MKKRFSRRRTSAKASKAKDGAKHRSCRSFVSLSREMLQFSKVFSKSFPNKARSSCSHQANLNVSGGSKVQAFRKNHVLCTAFEQRHYNWPFPSAKSLVGFLLNILMLSFVVLSWNSRVHVINEPLGMGQKQMIKKETSPLFFPSIA